MLRSPSGLVAHHRPGLVVADLSAGFIDRFAAATVLVARDLAPPVRLHIDPGTATLVRRLAATLEGIGVNGVRRVPVFLPMHATATEGVVELWCDAVKALGADPVVVQRPIAAASSLELEMAGRTHLMLEIGQSLVEVAVIVDGVVTSSRMIRTIDGGWRTVLDATTAILSALDPDQELDVRDIGVHAYGAGATEAPYLADMAGLAIAQPIGSDLTVTIGTQMIARAARGWLRAT